MNEQELREIVAQLRQRHPRFPSATIARLATRVAESYQGALIQTFVPLLVRREVSDQLRYAESIAVAEGARSPGTTLQNV